MDRRQFLIRLGLLAGEPLLKSFFDRALAFVENHDEPLLEVPREVRHELFVKKADYGYEWCLGRPETSIPRASLNSLSSITFIDFSTRSNTSYGESFM